MSYSASIIIKYGTVLFFPGICQNDPHPAVLLYHLYRGAYYLFQPKWAGKAEHSSQHQWQPERQRQYWSYIWTKTGFSAFESVFALSKIWRDYCFIMTWCKIVQDSSAADVIWFATGFIPVSVMCSSAAESSAFSASVPHAKCYWRIWTQWCWFSQTAVFVSLTILWEVLDVVGGF